MSKITIYMVYTTETKITVCVFNCLKSCDLTEFATRLLIQCALTRVHLRSSKCTTGHFTHMHHDCNIGVMRYIGKYNYLCHTFSILVICIHHWMERPWMERRISWLVVWTRVRESYLLQCTQDWNKSLRAHFHNCFTCRFKFWNSNQSCYRHKYWS